MGCSDGGIYASQESGGGADEGSGEDYAGVGDGRGVGEKSDSGGDECSEGGAGGSSEQTQPGAVNKELAGDAESRGSDGAAQPDFRAALEDGHEHDDADGEGGEDYGDD